MTRNGVVMFVAGLGLLAALLAITSEAEAHANVIQGCTRLVHESAAGSRSYKINIGGSSDADVACANTAGHKIAAGSCATWTTDYTEDGTPPAAPTGIHIVLFSNDQFNGHGATGGDAWTGNIRTITYTSSAAFDGQSISLCATGGADTGQPARVGTYRVIIRVCAWVGATGDGCTGTTPTYQTHTDSGTNPHGNLGTGNSVSGDAQGYYIGGITPTCFGDSTTLGGADFTTYTGGDARTLRLCGQQSVTDTGIEAVRLQIISQAGSALDTSDSTTIRSGANADATFGTVLTFGDSYTNNTNPTKRASITATSGLTGLPWTYFTAAPAGMTLTSETQIDAAWGLVDKGLRVTCTVQNPVTGSGVVTLLNRGEQAQCRSATVKNARSQDLASGTFLRVNFRRSTQSVGDTTDAPNCDTTTGASGAWTCDATMSTSATTTAGVNYVLDVRQFSSAARTTEWNRFTLNQRFDITSTYTISPSTGGLDCGAGVTIAHTVWHKGEAPYKNWKMCNARGEQITPSVTGTLKRAASLIVEHTQAGITPSSGVYNWTTTVANTAGSTHTAAGLPRLLEVTHNGNTATQDPVYSISTLLVIDSIRTWRSTCSGTQTSSFVIAADIIAMNEGVVSGARGNTWTRQTTFDTDFMENVTGATIASQSSQSATGTSSCHLVAPTAPASDGWAFFVNASDASGNWGHRWRTITFISPLTSIYDIAIAGNTIPTAPGRSFNLVIQTLRKSDDTGILEPFEPSDPPAYRINYTDTTGRWKAQVPTTTVTEDAPSPASWWINWTIPASWPQTRPALLVVTANMSGVSITRTAPLIIYQAAGGDPLWVWAADVLAGQTANVTIHSEYDNGTARTGAATNMTLFVSAPDGSWIVNGVNPIEITYPGGLKLGNYYKTFTATLEGAYVVTVYVRTDLNEIRSAKPWGFRGLADPDAHLKGVEARVNATQAGQTAYLATRGNATHTDVSAQLRGAEGRLNASQAGQTDYLASSGNTTKTDVTAQVHGAEGRWNVSQAGQTDYLSGRVNVSSSASQLAADKADGAARAAGTMGGWTNLTLRRELAGLGDRIHAHFANQSHAHEDHRNGSEPGRAWYNTIGAFVARLQSPEERGVMLSTATANVADHAPKTPGQAAFLLILMALAVGTFTLRQPHARHASLALFVISVVWYYRMTGG